ncbi:DUF6443 domain-containing protein [Chryseobacterium gwangjuense]|uniref:DUF6443 domain-containing protein n=1 Tax=Chryseobacterium gwangjuense TaxID=1069980 RepID=UPI001E578116|nr:DUF6443 domain-containing protein [Chryseobacterium gwangjuense]MCE3076305.1 DUF6443 domain-containing protein [Chryseobacterium gwangjuense]
MKKILLIGGFLLASGQLIAQSISPTGTKNYIYTKGCLDADCVKKAETVQYFDGLGRPKQIVGVKASPSQKDVVSHIEYDPDGRISKSYLPVPQTGTQNGSFYDNPLDNATNPDIYGAEKIYSKQVLENLPLARVKEAYNVGNAWSDKPVTYTYKTNTSATEVKKYGITTTWVESRTDSQLSATGAYYPVNSLIKTSVTDEDGNTTAEYKNGKGQTVLIRKNDGTQDVDTYYIYNEYGQLAFVIPPLASVLAGIDEAKRNSLCYQYRYDEFGRLVEKRIPGKGWEYLVYDKQDRLVLTQDALLGTTTNNFTKKGWMFSKYDQFGRIVYTGFFASTATRSTMQTALNNMTVNAGNNEERSSTPFTLNGIDVYYTQNAFPTGSMTILSVNYYDTYPQLPSGVSIPTQILGQNVLTQDSQNSSVSTKTLPTATYTKNIEDDSWTKDFIWYDMEGRAIGSHSVNHLGGYTQTESLLDFAGVVQNANTYHLRKSGETGVTVRERYTYDPQNRLLQHYHKVDGNPNEELLTDNTYNELSQLKNKKVGNNLQSIDYAYNIRGWLTDVNRDQMEVANLDGKLFAYKIKYNQKQGIDNPDSALFPNKNVTARYNGNIAEIDWRSVETIGVNPSLTPKRYGYAYDKLNRLSAGYYQNPNNPYSKENTESLDYDLNGNISNLYRTSVNAYGSNTATVIDNLVYDYNGNQATNINDYSYNQTGYEGGGQLIKYDLNGNMTEMPDKGIDAIKYNFLNLSNYLHLNRSGIEDITINTKYSAAGTKLRKENTTVISGITGSTTTKTTTDYLDGFQYTKVEAPGSGGGGDPQMFSARAMEPQAFSIDSEPKGLLGAKTADLQFLPTAEGFYDYINDQYIYQYIDHLGNVRVSFVRNSAGGLQLKDNNDYYPFGMNHLKTGNAYFGAGSYVKYKFGGKELQEFGAYDFGARIYMADIGRWFAVDPMAEQNSDLTPYRYGFNSPLMFTDPNGMLEMSTIDSMMEYEGTWYNTGSGFTNNSAMKSIDYDGNFINWGEDYTNGLLANIGVVNGGGDVAGTATLPLTWVGDPSSITWAWQILANQQAFVEKMNSRQALEEERQLFLMMNAGRLNDHGVTMIGGTGDFLGIFDIAGQVMSTWEPKNRYLAMAAGIFGAVALKKPGLALKEVQGEGKIIGLGINADLALHRGTGAITWQEAQWQKAGLTKVDWAKALFDKYHFRSSFREAAENAAGIRFEVTNFNPLYHKPGMTNFEFDHILSTPALLNKTTFIKGGNQVLWNGVEFISK